MAEPKYPRGSEWRRWDLQVHTPYSALNNGFGSDFENYASILFRQALARNVAAIGVTDYFTIEGYKQLRRLLADGDKLEHLLGAADAARARQLLLIPNVELRSSVIVTRPNGSDSRVNFHVLFSDNIDPAVIDEHFLRELHFTAEANPLSQDERWSLTTVNLEALGRRLKEQHAKFAGHSDLYVGMMNAVVTHEEVTERLTSQPSRFKDRYLIVVPADEDLSKCSWDGQGHQTRKVFLQKAQMLRAGPGSLNMQRPEISGLAAVELLQS